VRRSRAHSGRVPAEPIQGSCAREHGRPIIRAASRGYPRRRVKASSIPTEPKVVGRISRVSAGAYKFGGTPLRAIIHGFVAVLPHSCGDRTTIDSRVSIGALLAKKVYFLGMALIAASMSIVLSSMSIVLSSAASTFYFTLSHFELSRGQLNFRCVGVSPRYRTFEECQGSLFSNTHTFTNTDTLTTDAPNAHLWSGPKADHSVPHKILVMLACR
jgi:hypothetical protein